VRVCESGLLCVCGSRGQDEKDAKALRLAGEFASYLGYDVRVPLSLFRSFALSLAERPTMQQRLAYRELESGGI